MVKHTRRSGENATVPKHEILLTLCCLKDQQLEGDWLNVFITWTATTLSYHPDALGQVGVSPA